MDDREYPLAASLPSAARPDFHIILNIFCELGVGVGRGASPRNWLELLDCISVGLRQNSVISNTFMNPEHGIHHPLPSMHDIWIDPVWSKVIATFIWAALVGLVTLVLGQRGPKSYPLFQLLGTKIPAWYYLVSLLALLLLELSFPDHMLLGCVILSVASVVVSAVWFRKQQTQLGAKEATTKESALQLIYDSAVAESFSLRSSTEQRWQNNTPVGDRAEGNFLFDHEKVVNITRTNKDGRLVVHIDRYQGESVHRVDKKSNAMANRVVQIDFEAQVTAGSHTLLFVAKKMDDKWVHNGNKQFIIDSRNWQRYSNHFSVPNTVDFILFFEDGNVSVAPSTIQIRNLAIQIINK